LRTALLDVNVLIALLWPAHEHFDAAHDWFARRGGRARWATCPLTQLAFVRIVSNPAFSPDALAPAEALGLLERNLGHPAHEFWPDDVSLVESVGPLAPRLQGHRQLSDAYLLGLALEHRGKLASFDGGLRGLAAGDRAAGLELVPTSPTPRGRR
jgi:toxin-antitoxin system PIN domain toxin